MVSVKGNFRWLAYAKLDGLPLLTQSNTVSLGKDEFAVIIFLCWISSKKAFESVHGLRNDLG